MPRITDQNSKLEFNFSDYAGIFTVAEDFKGTWQFVYDAFKVALDATYNLGELSQMDVSDLNLGELAVMDVADLATAGYIKLTDVDNDGYIKLTDVATAYKLVREAPTGFGVCRNPYLIDEAAITAMSDLRVNYVRVDLKWADVETELGVYDFSTWLALMENLNEAGIKAIFILDYNNVLYQTHLSEGLRDELNAVTTEANRTGYANFCAAAVNAFKHYGDKVIWELWNEPNLTIYWAQSGLDPLTPANAANAAIQYMDMIKVAVPAMRAIDPGAYIIGGCVNFAGAPEGAEDAFYFADYVNALGDNDLFDTVDALSGHSYEINPPEAGGQAYFWGALLEARTTYAKNPTFPIVCTEMGYSTATGYFTDAQQADYLAREYLWLKRNGINLFVIYDLYDDGSDPAEKEDNFGLIENNMTTAKASYDFLQYMIYNLIGYEFISDLSTGDSYALLYSNGTNLLAITWAVTEDHFISVYGASIWSYATPTLTVFGLPVALTQNQSIAGVKTFTSGLTLGSEASYLGFPIRHHLACSDEVTPLTTGLKLTFRVPDDMTVQEVRASLTTAQDSGDILTIDIRKNGVSILDEPNYLSIDNTDKTSIGAANAATISDTALEADDEITVHIIQVGNGSAAGLKVLILGVTGLPS